MLSTNHLWILQYEFKLVLITEPLNIKRCRK